MAHHQFSIATKARHKCQEVDRVYMQRGVFMFICHVQGRVFRTEQQVYFLAYVFMIRYVFMFLGMLH